MVQVRGSQILDHSVTTDDIESGTLFWEDFATANSPFDGAVLSMYGNGESGSYMEWKNPEDSFYWDRSSGGVLTPATSTDSIYLNDGSNIVDLVNGSYAIDATGDVLFRNNTYHSQWAEFGAAENSTFMRFRNTSPGGVQIGSLTYPGSSACFGWGLQSSSSYGGNKMMICNYDWANYQSYVAAQSDPTLVIRSNTRHDLAQDEYIAFQHDRTDGVIWAGEGNIRLDNHLQVNPSSVIVLDTASYTLRDNAGTNSINWDTRQLLDNSGSIAEDWGVRKLYDSPGTEGVDWDARLLSDASAGPSVQWTNRELQDSGANTTLNWESTWMNDTGGTASIDWSTRIMYDSGGTVVVDYQSLYLYDNSGNGTLGWGDHILYHNAATSLDWANRLLNDSSSFLSLSWENRSLNDTTGTNVFDWSGAVLASTKDITVPDEVYGVAWNGSLEVPTKNAIYDRLKTLNQVVFTWVLNQRYRTGTTQDAIRIADDNLTIIRAEIIAVDSGSGGQTIVDINVGNQGSAPTTIFTTQANRPTLTAGSDYTVASGTPDITTITAGQIITADIDEIATGNAEDLTIQLYCEVT